MSSSLISDTFKKFFMAACTSRTSCFCFCIWICTAGLFGSDTAQNIESFNVNTFNELTKINGGGVLLYMMFVILYKEVTKIVYFIGNEHMLIAHDSNRLRFS